MNQSPSPFWHYVSTRYPLPLHLFYSLVWTLAISGTHAAVHDLRADWKFGWLDAFAALSATALFFFMRTVDEIKDEEYDRRFKPDRALVQGAVTSAMMWRYAAIAGILLFAANFAIHWSLALAVLGVMAYSVGILAFERAVPAFGNVSMYISTPLTIQLKSGAVAYLFLLNTFAHGGSFSVENLWLVAAFVSAYFHWEMGRKLWLPQFIRAGELSYTLGKTYLGVLAGMFICLALLAFSVGVVWEIIVPRLPANNFSGFAWLPVAGLAISALGMPFVFLKKSKRFPLGVFTQIAYAGCFLFGLVFLTHQNGEGSMAALAAPLFFLLNPKLFLFIQLKIFKGFVNFTAAVAQTPFDGFSKALMRTLANINCAMNGAKAQPDLPAVAQEWKRMFPINPDQMPLTKITDDTVFMEIREPCPLRDKGVEACNRLMEFDRQTLAKLGAQIVVLRSQAEKEGVTVCQLALRKPGADLSDLQSIYDKK